MNDFISTFSFYGVLRILIPGLYFFLCLNNIFIASNITFNLFQNETLNSIAVSIIVITLGLIIYAFDFPRMIRKMTSKLPSNQIKKKHPALAIEKIESQYFSFYYSSPEDIKERTEKYNGFFHLAINLFSVSVFILIIEFLLFLFNIKANIFPFVIFILLSNLFIAYMIYKKRLEKTFDKDFQRFLSSNQYTELINNT